MLINRKLYVQRLVDSMNNGLIKVITGIRRCGKSFLLFQLFKDYLVDNGVDEGHIIALALDNRNNKELRDPDKLLDFLQDKVIDDNKYYILLDEIQLVSEFEDVLNSLLHISNVDVYVTGSNSRFLSSDIITEFRGRGDEIHVLPLSFSEFLEAYDGSKERAFTEYMLHGGMPLSLSFETDEKKEEYLKHLFKTTYLSDIVERYNINDVSKIDELIKVLASSVGSLVNAKKIADTFKTISDKSVCLETVEKYLSQLEDSFIVSKVGRYDIKGRKNIGATYKYYFADVGLRNAKLDFLQSDYGHVMENIIYNELIYRGYSINVGAVVVNGKDEDDKSYRTQLEVDFMASKGSKRYYIQSAYQMTDVDKVNQEKRSLLRIDDNFKKIIIVRDSVKVLRDEHGITTIGIVDFLSDINSLDW